MSLILPAFARYPKEARIIGELLAGYGELEFMFAHCVSEIIEDEDVAFKVMFRARGEEQRVILGDALARPGLPPGPYLDMFCRTVAGLRHCLKIRNQYAHCAWGDDSRGLWFVALEENAKGNTPYDLTTLTQKELPLEVLEEQENFFVFIKRGLTYLTFQRRFEVGKLSNQPAPAPTAVPLPPLQKP